MSAIDSRLKSARACEREFLATLLRNPSEIADVRDTVSVDALQLDQSQRVYRAALRIHDRRGVVDVAGVYEELRSAGELGEVGLDWLADLISAGGTAGGLPNYAARVVSLALQRDLHNAALETVSEIERPTGTPEELLDRAQARLERLSSRSAGARSASIADVMHRCMDQIDRRHRGERRAGVPTGFRLIDDLLCGGLPDGGLTIIAARPSVGKTSFALNVARNVCRAGGAVLVVSLEQREGEIGDRLASAESGVPGGLIRTGRVNPAEASRLAEASQRISGWRMQVNDLPSLTAGQIAAAARTARRQIGGLDLVIVDYLNLVKPENDDATRNEQVGASATRLRVMARELDVPVLLLSQLNRLAAGSDVVPKLHHLRDSGEIEQVADVVAFLHRAGEWQPGLPDRIEMHIEKQRNGPLGVVNLEHDSKVYTFSEANVIL